MLSQWVSVTKCMTWLYRSGICNTKQSQQSVSMWIKCLMTFPLTVKAKREHIWHRSAKPYDSISRYPAMFFFHRDVQTRTAAWDKHTTCGVLCMHFMHKCILIMVTLNSEGRGQYTGRGRDGQTRDSWLSQCNSIWRDGMGRESTLQPFTKHGVCRVSQLTNSDFSRRDSSGCAYRCSESQVNLSFLKKT